MVVARGKGKGILRREDEMSEIDEALDHADALRESREDAGTKLDRCDSNLIVLAAEVRALRTRLEQQGAGDYVPAWRKENAELREKLAQAEMDAKHESAIIWDMALTCLHRAKRAEGTLEQAENGREGLKNCLDAIQGHLSKSGIVAEEPGIEDLAEAVVHSLSLAAERIKAKDEALQKILDHNAVGRDALIMSGIAEAALSQPSKGIGGRRVTEQELYKDLGPRSDWPADQAVLQDEMRQPLPPSKGEAKP